MPRLFVATVGQGLLRSDDLGSTWTSEPWLPSTAHLYSLWASPGELLVGGEGVAYRYSDRAWGEMALPPDSGDVWAISALEGTILAGTRPLGLFRSSDGGRTWDRMRLAVPHAPRVTAILPNPAVPKEVWAAVEMGGVFASDDGGERWSPANDRIPPLDVHALAWSSGGILVAATPAGVAVWRSARWVESVFEPADRYCRALASRPDETGTLYCGFGDGPCGTRGGVAVSTDGGRTWRGPAAPIGATSTIWSVATASDMPGLVLACAISGQVFLSRDGASSWTSVLTSEAQARAVACLAE